MIERKRYLDKLISKKQNGLIKVITGIRRCGKSYLLFNIYKNYLISSGVDEKNIICLALDDDENIRYRNPLELGKYIRSLTEDKSREYYVFLDEIQKVAQINNPYVESGEDKIGFTDVLLGLMKRENLDIYVTGSNSKMLSSDILTEFRGRGDEIRVSPLSYSEFYNACGDDKNGAWQEYVTYGGMPFIMSRRGHEEKARYLTSLFDTIYISDIMERNSLVKEKSTLDDILNIISSSVGSLTNSNKIANTFKSRKQVNISPQNVGKYLDYFLDAFLIYKAERYDVKGRKYIGSPLKYYFSDIGLRNARLNFRQTEINHIMENIIYNELIYRDFSVAVGAVEYFYKDSDKNSKRSRLEIDFVANKGSVRYYIQSALTVSDEQKRAQEVNSLKRVGDSFKKIVVVSDDVIPHYDEDGIFYVGIERFLLDETVMSF
ncbi:MAG: ATP-binding protein [Oscillospiraceae bacterium]|nr:ATP-binding protein [Oscillospiraceae bacterium]